MEMPSEAPVMILPNAILFPQAMLPLYIFEPRYRKMLADVLHSHRMFSVAMRKPGRSRETPVTVAGLGLVRASVANRDGTSRLILQGIARVELAETVRYKPYRVHRIRPLPAAGRDSVVVDALAAKVRELVAERLKQGFFPALPLMPQVSASDTAKLHDVVARAMSRFAEHLGSLDDPEQAADLVTGALLANPADRQTILETVDLADRLKHLVHFLMAEIRRHRQK